MKKLLKITLASLLMLPLFYQPAYAKDHGWDRGNHGYNHGHNWHPHYAHWAPPRPRNYVTFYSYAPPPPVTYYYPQPVYYAPAPAYSTTSFFFRF